MNALVIGAGEMKLIGELKRMAEKHPVNAPEVVELVKTVEGKARHMVHMSSQSIPLPLDYLVTYSLETGHPVGLCRHLSMSSGKKDHVPSPTAVWAVAELLGFINGLEYCVVYKENAQRGSGTVVAINVIQPVAMHAEGNA
jgi:hypothetical protein